MLHVRPSFRRSLLGLAAVALVVSAAIALTGGVAVRVAGLAIRAQRPWTALTLGLAVLALAATFGGLSAVLDDIRALWLARDRIAVRVAVCAALGSALIGLVWGTWAASGADAYGYISQALQWKTLRLVVPVPLAAGAPWPSPEWTCSPLGWRPGTGPGTIVPTYAPGLPLVMAAAARLAGNSAMFWIVPIAGALAVWLTWRLGTLLSNRTAAATAAALLAASPTFLFQIVQPMSDVPVTAWWTGALVAMLAGRPRIGGLCVSGAILTRPNLAPLALWLALWPLLMPSAVSSVSGASWPARLRFSGWFVLGALPGTAAWLGINRWWYGNAFASGYGPAGDLFSSSHVAANAAHYTNWLLHAHTAFIALGLVCPLVVWRASRGLRSRIGAVLIFAVLVAMAYLPYVEFQDWTYLRFLLPALPVLLVLACDVATRVVVRLPAAGAAAAWTTAVLLLVAHQFVVARDGQAFALQRLEHRYVEAGQFAARQFPPSAVFLAVQHSGSLRLYAGRPTLRWDLIEPASFDRVLAHLAAGGFTPYIAVEAWEEPQLRDHLSASSLPGRLDWPPAAELGLSVKVRFYDPRDRAAFFGGQPVRTIRVAGDTAR
jgi:hypothetical protein